MTNFTIDITSDPICVFCYLGKRRLEKAISLWHKTASKTDTFTISWKPYYLQPNLPAEGVDKIQKMTERMGEEKAKLARKRLLQMGQFEGIDFHFGGKIRSTRDSHRLTRLAEEKGEETTDKVVERLFHEFHENENDIGDRELLVRIGTEAGLDAEEVRLYLEGDNGGEECDREAQEARDKGIIGVPYFRIQDKYVIDSAQDPSDFMEIFQKVREDESGR
ncbi:DSBA oxidoreductase [Rhizodiscina lignyota]|uniref:DSBA oxidoreductase n=1 Tax=Rhizodiscina lignyota TaxID=1504668 RepID=A0A9P4M362_9PEZI|nr:DSBA oxidoreductase [Rhizodiscina lignyota]